MSVMEVAAKTNFADLTFDQKLDRLAEVAVQIGLGLRAGQELIVSAPIEALPLVRRITEHAYNAGVLLVTTFYSDDPSVLARYEYAGDASFDYAPTWLHDAIAAGFRSGAARLAIAGANPALLAKQDPAKVARANVAASKAGKPAMELITRHEINWTIVACATPEWAKLVFPGEPENIAVAKLWDSIFIASRIAVDDPVQEWREHGARLKQRMEMLNTTSAILGRRAFDRCGHRHAGVGDRARRAPQAKGAAREAEASRSACRADSRRLRSASSWRVRAGERGCGR